MDQGEDTELNYCYNCMRRLEEGQTVCPDCGHDNSLIQNPGNALPEGTILSGKYLVGRELGQGGFGITYLGFDLPLQVRVAIKEYFPVGVGMRIPNSLRVTAISSLSDPEGFRKGCEEFQAEAQTLARFNSPNIVHVRDYFRENGTAYIVMDYVEGNSLTQEVAESGGKISWEQVLSLFKPLILEMDKLHKKHLIHRDIKPDNLKITTDEYGEEHLVLLDFGSARSFVSSQVTKTYTAMVTPGYAPLEQYSSKSRQGPFTDIYALCATMYAAIMGEIPVIATDRVIGEGELVPFRQIGLPVPDTVEKAIFHGMEVLGSDRPQSMKELYDELTGVISVPDRQDNEKREPLRPVDNDKEGPVPSEKEPEPAVKKNKADKPKESVSPEKKKNIWLIPLLLIVLLAAGFFLYRGIWQDHSNTDLTQTAASLQELQGTREKKTREAKEEEVTRAAQERMTEQSLSVQKTGTQDALFAAETADSWNETKQSELRMTETQAAVSAENTQTVQAGRMEQTVQSETQWAQQTQAVKDANRTATAWFISRDMELRQTQTQSAENIQSTLAVLISQTEQAAQTAEVLERAREAEYQQTMTQAYVDMNSTQQAFEQQTAQAVQTAGALERTREAQAEQTAAAWERTQAVFGLVQTDIVRTQEAVVFAEQTRSAWDKTVEVMATESFKKQESLSATQTKAAEPTATKTPFPTFTGTPQPTLTPTPTVDPAILTSMGEAAYLEGDYDRALEYLIPSSEQGYASAQIYLGYMYEMGYGVTQSYEKAVEWYQKAADQGLVIAQFDLGNMYAEGLGVVQSYEKAAELYQKAADQGLGIAQYNLGKMYENGNGVTQSYEKAVELYQKAADQRLAAAQSGLGYLYENGFGVTQSLEKALYWYQKAADQGNEEALNKLEALSGKEVIAEDVVSEESSSIGLSDLFSLGDEAFQLGDYETAWEMYQKAADLGDEEAKVMAVVAGIRSIDSSAADLTDVVADTPMRADPSSAGVVMGSLFVGNKVTLTGGKNGAWIQVRTEEGLLGWVPESAVLLRSGVPAETRYITFGHYEQDNNLNNGPEAIEWQVLTVEDDRALIISRYALDVQPYHESRENVTWEMSTLRQWLNSDFWSSAFSETEKRLIAEVTNQNQGNAGGDGGHPTSDKVFLLSIDEAEQYFLSDEERSCEAAIYAKARGALCNTQDNRTWWWLRSPGKYNQNAANVKSDGSIYGVTGNPVNNDRIAVRPAVWVILQ